MGEEGGSKTVRTRSFFKACKNCKALVNPDVKSCPICGESSFAEEWSGILIVFTIDSEAGKIAKVERPWRYAIQIK